MSGGGWGWDPENLEAAPPLLPATPTTAPATWVSGSPAPGPLSNSQMERSCVQSRPPINKGSFLGGAERKEGGLGACCLPCKHLPPNSQPVSPMLAFSLQVDS